MTSPRVESPGDSNPSRLPRLRNKAGRYEGENNMEIKIHKKDVTFVDAEFFVDTTPRGGDYWSQDGYYKTKDLEIYLEDLCKRLYIDLEEKYFEKWFEQEDENEIEEEEKEKVRKALNAYDASDLNEDILVSIIEEALKEDDYDFIQELGTEYMEDYCPW